MSTCPTAAPTPGTDRRPTGSRAAARRRRTTLRSTSARADAAAHAATRAAPPAARPRDRRSPAALAAAKRRSRLHHLEPRAAAQADDGAVVHPFGEGGRDLIGAGVVGADAIHERPRVLPGV